jgi:dihydrolipoamide dehydrogenase
MYDLTVIGSGPGGYVAAIRAAQLGMKVAIIERYNTLGGTCLNVGCIPSKALLDSSEHYHNAVEKFTTHGIDIAGGVAINMPQMMKRKADVVSKTCDGIKFLMKKNKITTYNGHGSFVSANKIAIKKADGSVEEIETKKTIIATGSKPITPAAMNYDKKRIITSTEALGLQAVPKTMVIIGGGVIGLELGSVYARLGCKVEVIEYMDRIIASMDSDCSKELQKSLQKIGISFHLGHAVSGVKNNGETVSIEFSKKGSEEKQTIEAEYCLLALGRRPYTDSLGLENAGVQVDERGRIAVNEHLESSTPGIYAIGDVIKGAMLAHKAEEEGVFVAETIAGQHPHINYNLIPGVVYTWPEVAAVGQTEEQLKEAGVAYKVGKFPFMALGRARASMDLEGMVKVLADANTDEILGVHMVGPRTADMIAEAVVLMEFRASAEDASRMSHAHPTYTEALKEAALDATGKRALHI